MAVTSTIWVYSDPKLMQTALVGVDAIMSSGSYTTLVTIFFLFALLATVFPAMFQLSSIIKYYISMIAVVAIMTMPTMDVAITPSGNPTFGTITVPSAPMLIALPASVFSTAGKWMAESYEQVAFVLLGISPDLRVFGANGGVIGGSIRAIMESGTMEMPATLSGRVTRAYDQCVIPTAIMWGSSYPTASLIKADCLAAVNGFPGDVVPAIDCLAHLDSNKALRFMADSMPIQDEAGLGTTCTAYSKKAADDAKAWAALFYGRDMGTGSSVIAKSYRAAMGTLAAQCPGGACAGIDTAELISGQINAKLLTESIVKEVSSGGESRLSNMMNLVAKSGTGVISGKGLIAYMPIAMDGILAIMTLLFPIVVVVTVLSAAQGGTIGKLGNFYTGFFALQMVPAVMAVLNSFMTYFFITSSDLAFQLASEFGNTVTSPTAINMIIAMSQAPASAMGYMMAAAPAITWAIVHQGSVPAGQMLGNMMSGGNSAAEASALRNYSAANSGAGNNNFMTTDTSKIATDVFSSSDGYDKHKDTLNKNAAGGIMTQAVQAAGMVGATGSGDVTKQSNRESGISLLTAGAVAVQSKSMGVGEHYKNEEDKTGVKASHLAKASGKAGEYASHTTATENAAGMEADGAENIGTTSAAEIGAANATTVEGTREKARGTVNAEVAAASEGGELNQQAHFLNQLLKSRQEIGGRKGTNVGAALANKSVQQQAFDEGSIGHQSSVGATGVKQKMANDGYGHAQQGADGQWTSSGRNITAGAAMAMTYSRLRRSKMSGQQARQTLATSGSAAHSQDIGMMGALTESLGFPMGSMNESEMDGFMGFMAKGGNMEALKEIANITAGTEVGAMGPDQKKSMGKAMGAVMLQHASRDSNFGNLLKQRFGDGNGGIDMEKMNSAMSNASMSDMFTQMGQESDGTNLSAPTNGTNGSKTSSGLSSLAANAATHSAQNTGKVIGTTNATKGDSGSVAATEQTKAGADHLGATSEINAAGGPEAFKQNAIFQGANAGAKMSAFKAAVASLNDEQVEVGQLSDSQMASYAADNNTSVAAVSQQREEVRNQVANSAMEWGRANGIKEYGHEAVMQATGGVASIYGDAMAFLSGGRGSEPEVSQQGNIIQEGTNMLEQGGALLSVLPLGGAAALGKGGLKQAGELLNRVSNTPAMKQIGNKVDDAMERVGLPGKKSREAASEAAENATSKTPVSTPSGGRTPGGGSPSAPPPTKSAPGAGADMGGQFGSNGTTGSVAAAAVVATAIAIGASPEEAEAAALDAGASPEEAAVAADEAPDSVTPSQHVNEIDVYQSGHPDDPSKK